MKVRELTDFQRLMLSWKELAPYNAAHVLQVSGMADLERWEQALNSVTREIVTGEVRVETSKSDLERTITDQLNRPFVGSDLPLRATLIANEQNHFLALTYDHWFADSPSIRALLHRAFEHYSRGSSTMPSLRQARRASSVGTLRAIANGLGTYSRHRRAARIHLRDSLDFSTGFFTRHFAPGTITAIRSRARQLGSKVNDVFIAAAAHVLGEHTADQRAASRRNEVAIASAVDLRDAKADEVFGFDVTYFSVVLRCAADASVADLVRAVAQQTGTMKTGDEIARFNLSLKCARFASNLTSTRKRRAELFRKGLPLLAAISNVNLSNTWVEDAAQRTGEPRLLDYLRVSPVGPLLPLVFTLTTIADRLSLCVSFRKTAFVDFVAANLADAFIAKLIAFSQTAL